MTKGRQAVEPGKKRVAMKPVSESARGWAEGLARELEAWPGVTLKGAFGMTLAYRAGAVFAALPKTRALYVEDAILIKFLTEPAGLARRIAADVRFAAGTMESQGRGKRRPTGEGKRWRIFVLQGNADVHGALDWLQVAYRLAAKRAH